MWCNSLEILYQNGHYGQAGYTLGNIFIWGVYNTCAVKLKRWGRLSTAYGNPPPPCLLALDW